MDSKRYRITVDGEGYHRAYYRPFLWLPMYLIVKADRYYFLHDAMEAIEVHKKRQEPDKVVWEGA